MMTVIDDILRQSNNKIAGLEKIIELDDKIEEFENIIEGINRIEFTYDVLSNNNDATIKCNIPHYCIWK